MDAVVDTSMTHCVDRRLKLSVAPSILFWPVRRYTDTRKRAAGAAGVGFSVDFTAPSRGEHPPTPEQLQLFQPKYNRPATPILLPAPVSVGPIFESNKIPSKFWTPQKAK